MIIEKKIKDVRIKIDTLGGEIYSFVKEGIEYLWGGDEKTWTGRSPHLFPCINITKTPKVKFKDGYYEMTKHGLVRLKEFELIEETHEKVVLKYASNQETLKHYPYEFEFFVTHHFNENGFRTSYEVVNLDKEVMPYAIGGHPGFRVPLHEDEAFDDYKIAFDQDISMKALYYQSGQPYSIDRKYEITSSSREIDLSYRIFDQDAIVIPNIESHSLKVIHRKNNKGYQFDYPGFPVLALWTKPHAQAPYICLEPWYGLPAMESDTDVFSQKDFLEYLNPQARKHYYYQMTIIDK